MAEGLKISEMTEVTGLLDNDLIPLVSNGANYKIQFNNLKKLLLDTMYPIGCKIVSSVNPSTWITGTTWGFVPIIYNTPNYIIRHSGSGLTERWDLVEMGQTPHNLAIYEWTRTA